MEITFNNILSQWSSITFYFTCLSLICPSFHPSKHYFFDAFQSKLLMIGVVLLICHSCHVWSCVLYTHSLQLSSWMNSGFSVTPESCILTWASFSPKLLSWKVTNDSLGDKSTSISPGICDYSTPDFVPPCFHFLNCGTSDIYKPWCSIFHWSPGNTLARFVLPFFSLLFALQFLLLPLKQCSPGSFLVPHLTLSRLPWATVHLLMTSDLRVQRWPFSWTPSPCELACQWLFPPRWFTSTSVSVPRMQSWLPWHPLKWVSNIHDW